MTESSQGNDSSSGGEIPIIEASSAADLDDLQPSSIVILADPADARLARAALRAGARAVLSRQTAGEIALAAAAAAAQAGLLVLSPDVAAAWSPELSAATLEEPLSARELEVLDLMAAGLANKIIAFRLGISEHTVKAHVSSIFVKLGAGSRTEAVSQAARRGLVML